MKYLTFRLPGEVVEALDEISRMSGVPMEQVVSVALAKELHIETRVGTSPKFVMGDLVRKTKGSSWEGYVVGVYSTELTREGYAIESRYHPGSVQIYPAAALELVSENLVGKT